MAYHFQMPTCSFLSIAGYEYFRNWFLKTWVLTSFVSLTSQSCPNLPPPKGSEHSKHLHRKIEQGHEEDGIWFALWQQKTAALGSPSPSWLNISLARRNLPLLSCGLWTWTQASISKALCYSTPSGQLALYSKRFGITV